MQATCDYLKTLAVLPEGSEASSECPEAVTLELGAAGVSISTFFQLLPLLLAILRDEQVRDAIAQIIAILKGQ